MTISEILTRDETFRYLLLARLENDCTRYLDYGNRDPKKLWALDEKKHLETMKAIWKSFSTDGKPSWLTWEQILDYEKQLLSPKTNPIKVSYNATPLWDSNGTHYQQRVTMSIAQFRALCDSIRAERENGYPRKHAYIFDIKNSRLDIPILRDYLHVHTCHNIKIAFLTLTQARYLQRYAELKDRLKNDKYNTYIQIV